MKGRYISVLVLLACRSKPSPKQEDIHTQLQQTISTHKTIMQQWSKTFQAQRNGMDIHAQLRETLAERKRLIKKWDSPAWDNCIQLNGKQAA